MKKIWMGAVLVGSFDAGRVAAATNRRRRRRATRRAPAAAGGAAATPDEANGGTVTGKVAFDGDEAEDGDARHVGQPGLRARAQRLAAEDAKKWSSTTTAR